MHRFLSPLFLYILLAGLFCSILGFFWISQGPSDQELLANYAKAADYFRALTAQQGWPWWTLSYNGGHSLADSMSTLFSYLLIYPPSLLFPHLDLNTWPKLVGLLFIFLSGLAMFFFVQEIDKPLAGLADDDMLFKAASRSASPECEVLDGPRARSNTESTHQILVAKKFSWSALAAALFYIISPQLSLRLAGSEHLVVAFSFLYPPLIFWSLWRLREEPRIKYAGFLAIFFSAMTLTYTRCAIVFLPAMVAFASWLFFQKTDRRADFIKKLLLASFFFIPLALLALLPLWRETEWMALFQWDPFSQWQKSFSLKTALSWIDRKGALLRGAPASFTVDQGGFYVGLAPLLVLSIFFLALRKNQKWLVSPQGHWIRIFLALALLLTWLSYGPRSVAMGHWEFLNHAQHLTDIAAPLAWLALIGQVYLIFYLLPPTPYRLYLAGFLSLSYLFIPGFILLQKIPLYENLRAPWFFWEVGGTFCLSVAAGVSASLILRQAAQIHLRWMLGLALLILALVDLAPYHARFAQSRVSQETWQDFLEVQNFLKQSAHPGRVYAISGRYFYLLTPLLSNKPLYREAFHGHFMLAPARQLAEVGLFSPDLLRTQLSLAGVSFILIDKTDVDTDAATQQIYRSLFSIAFENEHFALLTNEASLAPFFFGKEWIQVAPSATFTLAPQLLTLLKFNNLSIEPTTAENLSIPNLVGTADLIGGVAIKPEYQHKLGSTLQIYQQPLVRKKDSTIQIPSLPPTPGWVVISESFHPDWHAYADGVALPIHKAFGTFLAVYLPALSQNLVFQFKPPWWYSVALWITSGAWVLAFGWLGTQGIKKWRKQVYQSYPLGINSKKILSSSLKRTTTFNPQVLVVIPTYNERESLPGLLPKIFNQCAKLDLLVVDDHSPDGTASFVRQQPWFEKRLFLIERTGKRGYAKACREGLGWGARQEYDVIIIMDADGSHDPADIPRLLQALDQGADCAIGSRYKGGVRVYNWPMSRLLMSLAGGWYVRLLTGLAIADPTSGFKALRREVVEKLLECKWNSEGYAFNIETYYLIWKKNFRITEVPIIFTERHGGQSKMSLRIALEAALRVLTLSLRRFKKTQE